MYINTDTNQYPVSESEIRAAHPNTSFPQPFTPPDGYAWVFPAPQPTFDAVIRIVREVAPELTSKGTWEQRWEVAPRFAEYTDDQGVTHTVAQQEAAATAADQAAKAAATIAAFEAALTRHLDSTAQAKRYDNRITCALRAGFVGPFQAEGTAFAQWMDACNAAGYQLLADVQSGVRPVPTVDEFLGELPAMVWPT